MKRFLKITAIVLAFVMVAALAACGGKTEPKPASTGTDAQDISADKVFKIGVIQLLEHDALNAN